MEIQNFKMKVTPEQSRIVQQTLFNNRYKWQDGSTKVVLEQKTVLVLENCIKWTNEESFEGKDLPELTFQEFFDRYVKWCVKVTEENREVIYQWKLNNTKYSSHTKPNYYVFFDGTWAGGVSDGIMELTFEQFEKYVLKSKESKDMEKRIIGYKLKDECKQYEEAAIIIAAISKESFYSWIPKVGYNFGNGSELYSRFKKAGVLYLWFEPVFEENNYKIGEYVTDDDCKNIYKYGRYENGEHYPQGENSRFSFGTKLRRLTSEEIVKYQTKELYFGKVKFTIKKGDNFATTEYGNVTKEEIGIAIQWIENPPSLNGHKFNIKIGCGSTRDMKDLCNGMITDHRIAFGCQTGTLAQLKEIYNAFE